MNILAQFDIVANHKEKMIVWQTRLDDEHVNWFDDNGVSHEFQSFKDIPRALKFRR